MPRRRARQRRASKLIEKIKIEEIKPSSRQNPYIRFEQAKKLYRYAVVGRGPDLPLPGTRKPKCSRTSRSPSKPGERIAIIGPNGIGKTTLMRCSPATCMPTKGTITWVENAQAGYMPQDPQAEFAKKTDLFTWMSEWRGKVGRRPGRPRHARAAAVLGRRDPQSPSTCFRAARRAA